MWVFPRAHETADAAKMNELRARVEDIVADPETAERLKPLCRYACTRPAFTGLYYPVCSRDNVTLVDRRTHTASSGSPSMESSSPALHTHSTT